MHLVPVVLAVTVLGVSDGVVVHVPPGGLEFFADQVAPLVPESVPVPDRSGSGPSCIVNTVQWYFGNATGYIQVDKPSLTPQGNQIAVRLESSFALDATMETWNCLFNNYCDVWLDWSPLTIDVLLDVDVIEVDGRRKLDVQLADVSATTNLDNPDVYNCSGANQIENQMADMMPEMEAELVETVKAQVPDLVGGLLDQLDALQLTGSLSLGDTELLYDFEPSVLTMTNTDIHLTLDGNIEGAAEMHPCIAEDIAPDLTPGTVPEFGATAPAGAAYRVGGTLSANVLNQALHAAWRSGFLCMDINEQDGEPMNTDLLRTLGGDAADVLTDGGAMAVQVRGAKPPHLTLTGPGAGGDLELTELRVDIMGDVHGRMARVVGLDVSSTGDVDVTAVDGQILTAVDLAAERTKATLAYSELIPEAAPTLVELMPQLFVSMAPPLDDLVPPIDLPALAGLTILPAELTHDGDQYLSMYIDLQGQLEPGSCTPSPGGCEGCQVSRSTPASFAWWTLLVLAGLAIRRTRRQLKRC